MERVRIMGCEARDRRSGAIEIVEEIFDLDDPTVYREVDGKLSGEG
jgi:hypothetical protein